jgi:pimeloyl-ACP methyl ester carboxylesterase
MRRVVPVILFAALVTAACGGNGLVGQSAARDRGPTTTAPATTSPPTTAPVTSPSTTAPTGGATAEPSGFPAGWTPAHPLSWSACSGHDGFQCATLRVPLDWSNPTGTQIDLALARQPATGQKIGSLLSNPGGPGASGIDFLYDQPFDQPLLQRFDLVSWDPRGVGRSAPLKCGSAVPSFLQQDPDPDNATEQTAIDTHAKAVASQCAQTDLAEMPFLGTNDVARDLEAIRIALREPKLTYYGASYGTLIGERYLAMFGDHVRALVLDGVVDPTQDLPTFLAGQTKAMDAAIGRAVRDCTANPCGSALLREYDDIHRRVETNPLPGDHAIGPSELATAAIYATYDPRLWPALRSAIDQGEHGNGTALWRLASGYYDIGDWTAYATVTCQDFAHPQGAADYQSFVDNLQAISARFGGSIGNEMLPCAFWPVPTRSVAGAIAASNSPDILVLGNTGDAATPYQNSVKVAQMLTHGHLVTYHGEGHTSYGRDPCVDAAVNQYLIDLKVPPTDPDCAGSSSAA